MKSEFKESFKKDIKRVKNQELAIRIRSVIEEIEQIKSIFDMKNVKKLKGAGNYYRIKIGNYRVGLKVQKDTAIFVRFLHRKEIYRYFP